MAPRDTTNLSILSNHGALVLTDPDCRGSNSEDTNDHREQNVQRQRDEDHHESESDDVASHYRFLLGGISSPSFEEECRIAMESSAHAEYDRSSLPASPIHALSRVDVNRSDWNDTKLPGEDSFIMRRRTPKRPKKPDLKVTFTSISIREYSVVEGDHPCCRQGPALSLGWEISNETENVDLRTYEKSRCNGSPRRTRRELRLPASARKQLLDGSSTSKSAAIAVPNRATGGQRRIRSKLNPYDSMQSSTMPSPWKKSLRTSTHCAPLKTCDWFNERSDMDDEAEFEAAWLDEEEKVECDSSGCMLVCGHKKRSMVVKSRRSSLDHYMSYLECETDQFV